MLSTASRTPQAPFASRRRATRGPARRPHVRHARPRHRRRRPSPSGSGSRAPRPRRPGARRSSGRGPRCSRSPPPTARVARRGAPRPAGPRAGAAMSHSARSIAASACGRSQNRRQAARIADRVRSLRTGDRRACRPRAGRPRARRPRPRPADAGQDGPAGLQGRSDLRERNAVVWLERRRLPVTAESVLVGERHV